MPTMRVLTARQMREADRRTIEELGVPSPALMENAGREVASAIEQAFPDLVGRRVAILCGRGNNGGDGFVVARLLHQRGVHVSVFLVGRASEVKGDALANLERARALDLPIAEIGRQLEWERLAPEFARHTLVVDALFGTGLSAPLTGLLAEIVEGVNLAGVPIVSIDLPSGLFADTHDVIGPCIRATLTVALGAPKLPLVLSPASAMAGRLVVADIGIPPAVVESLDGADLRVITPEALRPLLPPRLREAHKGVFGHVLVVAGSPGKTGAAYLAASGALRSGAGLVTVATPGSCQQTVAGMGPEYMTLALSEAPSGTLTVDALEAVLAFPATVIAAGPGLGTGGGVRAFLHGLVERARTPLVLDADALNAFAGHVGGLTAREGQTMVVTPHPGEMARLLGVSTADVQANRLDAARTLAASNGLIVVLKGQGTVIATPDGRASINLTGNPGMATGGTGDVLTGMIAGWLAQHMDAGDACRLGVFVHGAAGDLAALDEGEVSMTAGDLARRIGRATTALTTPRATAELR
jgi:ADP-dependent NAD(P)H-hydrate dehydratase / NAD(P)H-hydrate epimerase